MVSRECCIASMSATEVICQLNYGSNEIVMYYTVIVFKKGIVTVIIFCNQSRQPITINPGNQLQSSEYFHTITLQLY